MNPVTKIISALQAVADHPLNRQNKLRAVLGYGFVQIACRLVPGEVCVEFPNQTHLLVSPRMKGAAHYITPRLCEFMEMAFVMHFLRPKELFADVGANIGAFTILAAGVVGARATAFEASPDTAEMLTRNVQLNGLQDRVKIIPAAAGRSPGTVRFSVGKGTENRVETGQEGGHSVTVKMTTLDEEFRSEPPVLLKVDVEGFEVEVFAGSASLLKDSRLQALIVEHNDSGAHYRLDEAALHREIREHGFIPCQYQPFDRRLRQAAEDTRGNIIYTRNLEAANERLRSAPPFSLNGLKV